MLELGILKTWNATTYKAGVQLVGSLTTYLDDISVATNIASSAMVVGNYVLVAIPGGNPRDACVVASWPAGSSGGGGGGTKIQDADGDTSWDVEQIADEDKVHGKVKGVEAFLLDEAGVLTLAKQSRVRAYRAYFSQMIPNNTWTKVQLNAEDFDTQNEFDSATNYRFTATKTGVYLGGAAAVIQQVTDGALLGISIYRNGVMGSDVYTKPGGAGDAGIGTPFVFQLGAGDHLEMFVYQNCGVSRPLASESRLTWFFVTKIG